MVPPVSRRAFLAGLVATSAAACAGGGGPEAVRRPRVPSLDVASDPFTLGVASGDPRPDSVVIWTRLAPTPEVAGGGMPGEDARVAWEVAADDGFRDLVQAGVESARADAGHTVHVDVGGLEPGVQYWYRFLAGRHESPPGRTRTAPDGSSSPERVAFGVASCQAWQSGYFGAYRHLAEEDVDAVLFLGDYIYELESSVAVRPHGLSPPQELDEFRRFYGLYKSDPDLQVAHAAHPWIVTWDDHEVEDNYAGLMPGAIGAGTRPDAAETFPAKRAAAYQAFWEHMPIRTGPPQDGRLDLARHFSFGDLVDLSVLDTRQFRDPPPPGSGNAARPRPFGGGPQPPGVLDEGRTLLGAEQEDWLMGNLGASETVWNVLAQQSIMAPIDRAPDDPNRGYSVDSWDGFVAARDRLLEFVSDEGVANLLSVGGDIHTSAVTDLRAAEADEPLGTELIGPSISALEILPDDLLEGARSNDHVHLYDIEHRGYLRVVFDRDECRADFRWLETTLEPESSIGAGSSWVVREGQPGAQEA